MVLQVDARSNSWKVTNTLNLLIEKEEKETAILTWNKTEEMLPTQSTADSPLGQPTKATDPRDPPNTVMYSETTEISMDTKDKEVKK